MRFVGPKSLLSSNPCYPKLANLQSFCITGAGILENAQNRASGLH
jgi:hypothetical protein